MNKTIKNILKIVLFTILMTFLLNSKVIAASAIDANATWTTSSGNTNKYDYSGNGYVSSYDFAKYAASYAKFTSMPAKWLRGKYVYAMGGDPSTISQKYAFCVGHGNTNRYGGQGSGLLKMATIIDVTPTEISAYGNGRVGNPIPTSGDPTTFETHICPQDGGTSARCLSALAYYAYENAESVEWSIPTLTFFLNWCQESLAKDSLLDYGIGFDYDGYTREANKDLFEKNGVKTKYGNYADKVQNHEVKGKTLVNSGADRKEGTYNGTKYDYWGPFQITMSTDVTTILRPEVTNAGSYVGIASSVGGQPKSESTTTVKSNTNFYVVTTTTTLTNQAKIKIKTKTADSYYKARLMFLKCAPTTGNSGETNQNLIIMKATTTPIEDEIEIKVTPSPKTGDLEITKWNSDKTEKLAGAVFELYDSNNNVVHFAKSGDNYIYYGASIIFSTQIIIPSSGTTTISNLPAGSYKLKEITAPTGYVAKATNTNVTITSGATKKVDIQNEKLGSLRVLKVDSSNNGSALAGAKFNLYKGSTKLKFTGSTGSYKYDTNGTITDLVVGSDGKMNVTNLPAGTDYKLKEIEAPVGYKLDSTQISVTITNENTTTKTVGNERIEGDLEIFKYDQKVGKTKPLAGGKFIIRVQGGYVIYATRQSAGVYKYQGLAPQNAALDNLYETNSSGKITILDIPEYINGVKTQLTITEYLAPEGYEKYQDNLYTTIEGENTTKVNVPENPETIDLKILKKSTVHPENKYKNVGFKVLCSGEGTGIIPKGWIKGNSNNEWDGKYYSYVNATTFYTNDDGYVTIKGLPRNCKYEVYEVDISSYPQFEALPKITIYCYNSTSVLSSGDAYAKETNEVPANAVENQATYTVSASNTENPGKMKIQKIDTSGKGRVDGIGFKVKEENSDWLKFDITTGEYLGKTSNYDAATLITTDSTGYTVQLNTIPAGTYHIYETDLGNYGDVYQLTEELNVALPGEASRIVNVKDCGTKTITTDNPTVTVSARNTPIEGNAQIQKIDTSEKGRVNGIGFKIYDTGNAKWLQFSSAGKYTGEHTLYEAGTLLTTDSTGYTSLLTDIPRGSYNVYEVDLGPYSNLYSLTEEINVHSYYQADGVKRIKVKDCGSFSITEDNMSSEKLVIARNTPDEKDGTIKIKKIDTSTRNAVSGIGFKIFNYETKEWVTCNETTGEYEDTVENIEDATELTTDETGYTITVTKVPPARYLVFETNLNDHTEYPALETISIEGKNNTTITFEGKQILSEETGSQYHNINADEETNLEIVAENTATPTPEKLVIKKVDTGTGNVVSGVGFKIYDETNSKWLQINTSTGVITGDTTDFESATELTTGANGYTVVVQDVPEGVYTVYETNLGPNINVYQLGTVTVKDDGNNVEKTGKLIRTGRIGKTGKTITIKAENEKLGKLRIQKVDTSDSEKIVEGIGFKVLQYNTNKWLKIDTTTGKVTGTTTSFDEATTIYTQNDGYTIEISDIPFDGAQNTRGKYIVYETDLGDHIEYELTNINVPHNGTTKVAKAKRIQEVTVKNTGEVVTAVGENSPIHKIKLSGYVWKNGLNYGKTSSMDNVYDTSAARDVRISGLTVELIDGRNETIISRATTDTNGRYEFSNIDVDDLENYSVRIKYDGIKYQVIDNKASGTNTNKFAEENRDTFNQTYSTITNNMQLKYNKDQHASHLTSNLTIEALTSKIVSTSGVVGTTTAGQVIADMAQIKNGNIDEITNINLGIYERTAPDLEVRNYLYQVVLTDKEDSDVDPQNTWKLNKMDLGQNAYEYKNWVWDKTENKFKLLTKTGNEAKKMYVIYKIALVNSSTGVNNKINSISNYFGTDHSFVKAKLANSLNSTPTAIASEKITVVNGTVTLNNLDIDVKSQKTAYVYLEFEISIEQLKEKLESGGEAAISSNYAEINSYTSYIGENTLYAGVDKDSAPGNINLELFDSLCEDDESRAPSMKITSKYSKSGAATATATDFIDKLISARFSE